MSKLTPHEVRVSIVDSETKITLLVEGKELSSTVLPSEPEPMGLPSNGKSKNAGLMFSPIEKSVLKVATLNWQTGMELAEKTGQTCSSWFRAILSNLVEREWLEGGRNGYRRRADLEYPNLA